MVKRITVKSLEASLKTLATTVVDLAVELADANKRHSVITEHQRGLEASHDTLSGRISDGTRSIDALRSRHEDVSEMACSLVTQSDRRDKLNRDLFRSLQRRCDDLERELANRKECQDVQRKRIVFLENDASAQRQVASELRYDFDTVIPKRLAVWENEICKAMTDIDHVETRVSEIEVWATGYAPK